MDLRHGNGVNQWMFQRFANLCSIVFGLSLLCVLHDGLSYRELTGLLANNSVKVYLIATMLILCLNSYLAGWQIVGDYAAKFHLPGWLLNMVIALVSLTYFVSVLILVI